MVFAGFLHLVLLRVCCCLAFLDEKPGRSGVLNRCFKHASVGDTLDTRNEDEVERLRAIRNKVAAVGTPRVAAKAPQDWEWVEVVYVALNEANSAVVNDSSRLSWGAKRGDLIRPGRIAGRDDASASGPCRWRACIPVRVD